MKILYVVLGLMMQTMFAQATVLPKGEQPKETTLYAFNEDFINAVENCSEYETEFSIKNTPYAPLAGFAGKMPFKSKFEIYYKDKDVCRMRVRLVALGRGETRFNCRLNDEQRALMVKAMRDKSTEEYVITLPTENEADCSGCSTAVTFSGNLFDTTLAMLKPKVCAELHIQPSRGDIEAARAYNKQVSAEFYKMFKKCTPGKAKNTYDEVLDGIEILGKAEDNKKCRIKFADFEMVIDPHIFKSSFSVDDLQRNLLRYFDDAKYDYENKYDGTGMLFALDECRKPNGVYDKGDNIFMHGNIQARNGLAATRVRDVCQVVLKNTVEIANIYRRDYSLRCNIPVAQIDSLTEMYIHLLEENGAEADKDKNGIIYETEARQTSETLKADADITAKVRDYGFCFAQPPIDPIKIEREDFSYSNSLPQK